MKAFIKSWSVVGLLWLCLCLMSWRAHGQTNVIYGNVGDYGMNPQVQVPVTLKLVSPNPRIWDNFLIQQEPVTHNSNTNGAFAFTNVIWGTYLLTAYGAQGTSITIYIWTNTLGSNAVQTLTTNFLNPAAYWSQQQSDQRYLFATNGGANGLLMTLSNGVWVPEIAPTLGGISVAASTGLVAVTNGAVITLSATNTGGGANVAAGTNITTVTNAGTVTVNVSTNVAGLTNNQKFTGNNVFIYPTAIDTGGGALTLSNLTGDIVNFDISSGSFNTASVNLSGGYTFDRTVSSTAFVSSGDFIAEGLGQFIGNGSGLTTIPASSLTGIVAAGNLGSGTPSISKVVVGNGNWTNSPSLSAVNMNNLPVTGLVQDGASVGQVLAWSGGAWGPTNASAGTGTLTSVGYNPDGVIFQSVTGAPVTGSSGTFQPVLQIHNANLVLAGPASGSAATSAFRFLVNADIPAILTGQLILSGTYSNSTFIGTNIFTNVVGNGAGLTNISISNIIGLVNVFSTNLVILGPGNSQPALTVSNVGTAGNDLQDWISSAHGTSTLDRNNNLSIAGSISTGAVFVGAGAGITGILGTAIGTGATTPGTVLEGDSVWTNAPAISGTNMTGLIYNINGTGTNLTLWPGAVGNIELVLNSLSGQTTNVLGVQSNGVLIGGISYQGRFRSQPGSSNSVDFGPHNNGSNGMYFTAGVNNAINFATAGTNAGYVSNGVWYVAINGTLTNNTTGNAATATTATTASSMAASGLTGTVAVANGGTAATTARATGANIGLFQASVASGNDAFNDISNAVPSFLGQIGTSYYSSFIPYYWQGISTSIGGLGNWTGSASFPGRLIVGDATRMNTNHDIGECAFIANGVSASGMSPTNLASPADNVMSLKNQASTHYSAVRFLSCDDDALGERGAVGYGNSHATFYPSINYLEDLGNGSGFYFVNSGKTNGGLEKGTGRFIWCGANGSTVNFSIDQPGNVTMGGNCFVTNNFRAFGTGEVDGNLTLNGYVHMSSSYLHSYSANGGVTAFSDSGNTDTSYIGDDGITLLSGGIQTALANKSSSYAILVTDSTILVTATGQIITLPSASSGLNSGVGHEYTIKLTASGSCTITNSTGSQTIDGATSYTLAGQYAFVTVKSDGSNWQIIALGSTQTSTLTQTNIVSGQLYTNLTGRPIMVSASPVLTLTGVAGAANMSLLMSGYLTNACSISTLITSLAATNTLPPLTGFVPAGQKYTFTNLSAGTGDSATIVGGQIMVY